jgi:membrane-bound toxin of toxin-antitoxin system
LSPRRLRVELAPSPFLAIAIVVLHAAAALCSLAVMPGAAGLALGALLLALGIATAWSRALLRSASSVRALELTGPKLQVELANGESFPAEVAERRYVGRFMLTLPLRRPVRRTILVTRDMADGDSFRRLRIWALWGKLPGVAAKQLPV